MTISDQTPSATALPLLEVKDLVQRYALPRESLFRPVVEVRALNGLRVQVRQAGPKRVGESGSGNRCAPVRRWSSRRRGRCRWAVTCTGCLRRARRGGFPDVLRSVDR